MQSSFEDPAVLSAMRDLVASVAALEAASDDAAVMAAASDRSLAALVLRRRLEELGWVAPARLRVGDSS